MGRLGHSCNQAIGFMSRLLFPVQIWFLILMGPRAGLDAITKRSNISPAGKQTPVVQPVAYTQSCRIQTNGSSMFPSCTMRRKKIFSSDSSFWEHLRQFVRIQYSDCLNTVGNTLGYPSGFLIEIFCTSCLRSWAILRISVVYMQN
jgi:hypothetical protein